MERWQKRQKSVKKWTELCCISPQTRLKCTFSSRDKTIRFYKMWPQHFNIASGQLDTLPHWSRDWWVFLVPGGSPCAQSWRPDGSALNKRKHILSIHNALKSKTLLSSGLLTRPTSSGADLAIFWNGSFRKEEENRDGLADATPRDAGLVSADAQQGVGVTKNWG